MQSHVTASLKTLCAFAALMAVFVVAPSPVLAQQAECEPVDTYIERSSTSDDSPVNFVWNDPHNVTITSDPGYTITEVWLDVEGDGHYKILWLYGTGPGTYDPPAPASNIHLARVRVIRSCQSEQQPTTPTPTPVTGKTLDLTNSGPKCNSPRFDAIVTLRDNGSPVSGTTVRFNYNGVNGEQKTNAEGKAQYGFEYAGPQAVTVQADGYGSKDMHLQPAENCPAITEDVGRGGPGVAPQAPSLALPVESLAEAGVTDVWMALTGLLSSTAGGVYFLMRRK